MIVYNKIYLVKDAFGEKAYDSCAEPCNKIQICGMKNILGEKQYFEAEAYHLKDWCETHGFEYNCIDNEYEFDELWKKK